jgi:hypothetical protein
MVTFVFGARFCEQDVARFDLNEIHASIILIKLVNKMKLTVCGHLSFILCVIHRNMKISTYRLIQTASVDPPSSFAE